VAAQPEICRKFANCAVVVAGKSKALQPKICVAIVGLGQGSNKALQADHAAFGDIALSLGFGPHVG